MHFLPQKRYRIKRITIQEIIYFHEIINIISIKSIKYHKNKLIQFRIKVDS